jgi:hypothetical protein
LNLWDYQKGLISNDPPKVKKEEDKPKPNTATASVKPDDSKNSTSESNTESGTDAKEGSAETLKEIGAGITNIQALWKAADTVEGE